MSRHIKVYKFPVPYTHNSQYKELMQLAGRIYSKTVSIIKKTHKRKGFWLSINTTQKYILRWAQDIPLHSQTKQALVEKYFEALKGYFKARKTNSDLKPPFRTPKYFVVIWKNQAVRLLKDGTLRLSMGNGRNPLYVLTTLPQGVDIRRVELVYDRKQDQYFFSVAVAFESKTEQLGNKVAGVDLGVIHPIVASTEDQTILYNGGELNAKLQYRNKKHAEFQRKLSKKKPGSRRYRKLVKAKRMFLKKTQNQINDILHKYTTHLVGWCLSQGIGTIAVGDLRGIRDRVDYNSTANQKIHQWLFRKVSDLIKAKAETVGVKVVFARESYTSQTCPVCGAKHKTSTRNFKCPDCGFMGHRDAVGAFNIIKKYTGESLVVGSLAYPVGVRYSSHLCCPVSMWSPWKPTIEWARTS
ncbi:transposase [Kosmotoga arenicorallina S304]|uniref:Transposase n=1 Tax=Kosmotoga arenicorallina S304 TaxID=1453497 RepID=A0A182C7J3_9BACT|nr:RNA-guided endonuclease TnpB family protein [Kosmotoga arenicorallina]OAA31584.1 transposase [Kosmotoga arenicorallina S304]